VLYALLVPLSAYFSAFNVFRYITFRSVYAAVTALAFSPDAVSKMTDFLRGALRGELPRVPSVRVETPFGAAVA
jgi:hypothetical protein